MTVPVGAYSADPGIERFLQATYERIVPPRPAWYEAYQHAYVEENGYTVTMPGFTDIFHIVKPPEVTGQQYREWYRARHEERPADLPPFINAYLDRKRRRFEAQLGSPSPGWLQSISSLMTFIDDVEDGVSTGVLLGRFALKLVPRIGARLIPLLGWALLAADIMELAAFMYKMPGMGRGGKRRGWDWVSMNPFHAKAKVRRAEKLLKKLPTVGELAEGLQTTDNLFGIGISFGAILGMGQDLVTGAVRQMAGQEVRIDLPDVPLDINTNHFIRGMKAASRIWFGGQEFDDELHRDSIFAYCVGQVHLNMVGVNYQTAYDSVSDFRQVEHEAPAPWRIDTRLMLEDEGINIEQHRGFPPSGRRWVGYEEEAEDAFTGFANNFTPWAARNSKDYGGFIASQFMAYHGQHFLERSEGRDNVERSMTDESMVMMHSLRRNFVPHFQTPTPALKRYCNRCVAYKQNTGILPPRRTAKWFGEQEGITWENRLPRTFMGEAREAYPDLYEEHKAGHFRSDVLW